MRVFFRPILPVLSAVVLAACTPTPPDDAGTAPEDGGTTSGPVTGTLPSGAASGTGGGEAVPGTELCDASAHAGLVGQNIAGFNLAEGPRLRVFSENDIVTRDYIPQRTNVLHREDGTVLEVYCG